jgi:hypothetical protein
VKQGGEVFRRIYEFEFESELEPESESELLSCVGLLRVGTSSCWGKPPGLYAYAQENETVAGLKFLTNTNPFVNVGFSSFGVMHICVLESDESHKLTEPPLSPCPGNALGL